MLFARILGYTMAIGGALLLQAPQAAQAEIGWAAGAVLWRIGGEAPSEYLQRSVGASLSAAQSAPRIAITLILLGVLMAWVCRRQKDACLRHRPFEERR